jgi:hypothetical protein
MRNLGPLLVSPVSLALKAPKYHPEAEAAVAGHGIPPSTQYAPRVFLLLFASRPAPTISSSEISRSCQNKHNSALNHSMEEDQGWSCWDVTEAGDIPPSRPFLFAVVSSKAG